MKLGRRNKQGHMSMFETVVIDGIKGSTSYAYEIGTIPFMQPAKQRTYKPDVIIPKVDSIDEVLQNPTKYIVVEIKGMFSTQDRLKHQWIQSQYPELDIRIVFQRPFNTISKSSKTTYAVWADRNNIKWADKFIPVEWIEEIKNKWKM
jgi:hypothetical protein